MKKTRLMKKGLVSSPEDFLPSHETFMQLVLALATNGRPSPNPYVGALIVKDGNIVGEGFHHQAGQAHAEVEAIISVYDKYGKARGRALLRGATLYVNLEPCAHTGRTPPCTDAIIAEKIGTVVFAMKDPNGKVKGNGEAVLRKAGVQVCGPGAPGKGVMEYEALELNRAFVKHCKKGLPYVTLKMAMSLDGKVASRTGDSKWVGGAEQLDMVQHLRHKVGAVMVGIGTVSKDNPRLTCRLKGGHSPLRVIVDTTLKISPKAKVLKGENVLLAVGPKHDVKKAKLLAKRGIRHVICPLRSPGHVKLSAVLKHVLAQGIDHVLCEGGPELASALLEEKLVDELLFSISPKIVGGKMAPGPIGGEGVAKMAQAGKVRILSVEPIGVDWIIRAVTTNGSK